MKYFSMIALFILLSCSNKEDILLPKGNTTIVKEVDDLSPIYIFFRAKGNDTLAEVNRKNSIISTNWILNIDKRLPLRIAIPEIMKLQHKKREEKAHKNEKAENYYSYADTVGKNLAFIAFTNVFYSLEKPRSGKVVFFTKNNEILVDNVKVKREQLQTYFNTSATDTVNKFVFCFAKEMSFETYIQNKILINSMKFSLLKSELIVFDQEFIY